MKAPNFGTKNCKYQGFQLDPAISQVVKGDIFNKITGHVGDGFKSANCTAVFTNRPGIGMRLPDGSYNGTIGSLTRGELNGTALGYVLGSDEDEPVRFGSVYWSTELSIISFKEPKHNITQGIENWISAFDLTTYLYILICVILFICCYIIILTENEIGAILHKNRHRRLTKERWKRVKIRILNNAIWRGIQLFPKFLWDCAMSMIYSPNFTTPNTASQVLVVTFSVAIFNLVFGYFLNLVSVDMIAVHPGASIDYLADLLDDHRFEDMKVVTLAGLWQEQSLRGSIPGSPENRLWNRIDGNLIPFALESSMMLTAVTHGTDIIAHKECFVIDIYSIDTFKSLLYQTNPHLDSKLLHTSKDWFGERLLVPSVSKSSDPSLLSWINYKIRRLFESAILRKLLSDLPYSIEAQPGFSYHQVSLAIIGTDKEENEIPDPFGFKFFRPLVYVCLAFIFLALFFLIFEIFMSQI